MSILLLVLVATAPLGFALAPTVLAQIDPPERRCADLTACDFAEINHAYSLQYESGCGANCSASYWVRDRDTGEVYVAVTGVPSAVIGVRGFGAPGEHPDVRVVAPRYEPGDPRCCPSTISDTLYQWSPAQGTLVVADERIISVREVNLELIRQDFRSNGFTVYFENRP